jgi:hypothetical protein
MSKPKTFEVINYYEKWADDDDDQSMYHYENEDVMKIKLPFRALLQGPSGSGKTIIAINLLSGIGIWDKVVILAKNLEEKLYRKAIEYIQKIEKAQKRRILLAIDNIGDLPPLSAFKKEENTLLIVDDFVADNPKSLIPLNEIWLRGRKNSISPVFISQSYFDTPKIIRKNSDYVFIKELGNPMDLARIAKEYALGVTPKEIAAKYQRTLTGKVTDFFLIDRFNQNPSLKYRFGFQPME